MIHYDFDQYFTTKAKYKSEEERNFYFFIKNYWKYLISISFHTNIYKEDIFKREQQVHNQLRDPPTERPELEMSESKIPTKKKDRIELLSQGLFSLVDVVEEISKLKSLSRKHINLDCIESNIVTISLQDLYYFYNKFFESIRKFLKELKCIEDSAKHYLFWVYEYYKDIASITRRVEKIFTGYKRLFNHNYIIQPDLFILDIGFNKKLESAIQRQSNCGLTGASSEESIRSCIRFNVYKNLFANNEERIVDSPLKKHPSLLNIFANKSEHTKSRGQLFDNLVRGRIDIDGNDLKEKDKPKASTGRTQSQRNSSFNFYRKIAPIKNAGLASNDFGFAIGKQSSKNETDRKIDRGMMKNQSCIENFYNDKQEEYFMVQEPDLDLSGRLDDDSHFV